ncbi:RHS repeat-associated core domain-containing protein [Alteromonas lipotrueae]|uniref:RHS repeat-associated core domain-containing protein n=1 Tax=Alteromonas lipotrueae TaxID=2803814 RepID=UPI001FECA21A|nr:RHS repeat-associated core domain-containing protein [Alteromonas lipotrueae]
MNGRVYDYNLGRFLSVDPLIHMEGGSQGINPYSYIMNNPLAGVDPTGYDPEEEVESFEFEASTVESITVNAEGQVTVNFNNGAESQSFQASTVSVGNNTVDIGNQTQIAQQQGGASVGEALSAIGNAIADNWQSILTDTVDMAGDSNPIMGAASDFVGAEDAVDSVIAASEGDYGEAVASAGMVALSKFRVADDAIKFGQESVKNAFAHGPHKGKTIGEVAEGLRNGDISPDSLPVEYVVRNGERVALNNRSLTTLRRAGMQPTRVLNRTGNREAERLLNSHLRGAEPSDYIRIRGAGPRTSSIE